MSILSFLHPFLCKGDIIKRIGFCGNFVPTGSYRISLRIFPNHSRVGTTGASKRLHGMFLAVGSDLDVTRFDGSKARSCSKLTAKYLFLQRRQSAT